MKRGRESFIIYKVLALLLFTMEVMLLLYLENILVAWKLYGLGDLNACLQSVNGFIGTGVAADLKESIDYCPFVKRCTKAMKICMQLMPEKTQLNKDHYVKCWLEHEFAPKENREEF